MGCTICQPGQHEFSELRRSTPVNGWAIFAFVTHLVTIPSVMQGLHDSCQEEIPRPLRKTLYGPHQEGKLLIPLPRSPCVYWRPQRPIGGAPLPQPEIGVPIEPPLACCGIVSRQDVPVNI